MSEGNSDKEVRTTLPSEVLTRRLEQHFGTATATTNRRYFDHLKIDLRLKDPTPEEAEERLIRAHMNVAGIDSDTLGNHALLMTETVVTSYKHMLEMKYPQLILKISSQGGNTSGERINPELEQWGKEYVDCTEALKEIVAKKASLSST